MTQNVTGLELETSHKIVVSNSTASCNTFAGFSLISSTTCVIQDSKALSTGEGNTNVLNQEIFGFVSVNGYGNIFERCIANSTQALSTTDLNSIVAGFALRGSEGCSKIIDSESANTTSNFTGYTVPYGILIEQTARENLSRVAFDVPSGFAAGNSVTWSPCGNYITISENNEDTFVVYEFDRSQLVLSEISRSVIGGGQIQVVDWSPAEQYIAVGDQVNGLFVYSFEPITQTLSLKTTTSTTTAQ